VARFPHPCTGGSRRPLPGFQSGIQSPDRHGQRQALQPGKAYKDQQALQHDQPPRSCTVACMEAAESVFQFPSIPAAWPTHHYFRTAIIALVPRKISPWFKGTSPWLRQPRSAGERVAQVVADPGFRRLRGPTGAGVTRPKSRAATVCSGAHQKRPATRRHRQLDLGSLDAIGRSGLIGSGLISSGWLSILMATSSRRPLFGFNRLIATYSPVFRFTLAPLRKP